ncbi:Amidinotransferase [Cooperia oncophora]
MLQAAGQLLKRVLMVPPKHYNIEYKINPWTGGQIDESKAFEQWKALKAAIEKQGVEVLTMEPVPWAFRPGIRLPFRSAEQPHYRKWFKSCKLRVFGDQYPVFFEGGGDAIFSDRNTLWAGYGPRSAKEVYEQLKVLGKFDTVICELIHPKFYHLDTCFTPVDRTTALWFPPAFSEQTKKEAFNYILQDSRTLDFCSNETYSAIKAALYIS